MSGSKKFFKKGIDKSRLLCYNKVTKEKELTEMYNIYFKTNIALDPTDFWHLFAYGYPTRQDAEKLVADMRQINARDTGSADTYNYLILKED